MRNLLSANLCRLWRSRSFWLCAAFMLVLSLVNAFNALRQAPIMLEAGYSVSLEEDYFNILPYIILAVAIFCALFLGVEYGEGTIRNKLIAGHSRWAVYLSSYLTCLSASLIFLALWAGAGLIGYPTLGPWSFGWTGWGVYLLVAAGSVAALTAIMTLLCMLFTHRAGAAVLALLLALGLLLAAAFFYNALCQPETVSEMIMTVNGIEATDPAPNPQYVSGWLRVLYQFLLDALPTGQLVSIADLSLGRPALSLASSAVIVLGSAGAGIAAFGRKDLK